MAPGLLGVLLTGALVGDATGRAGDLVAAWGSWVNGLASLQRCTWSLHGPSAVAQWRCPTARCSDANTSSSFPWYMAPPHPQHPTPSL